MLELIDHDVPGQVVDRVNRDTQRNSKCLCRGRADKQRAGKPWPPYEPLPPPMPDPPKPPPKRARPGLVRKYRASALPARRLERYRQLDPDGILVAESA